MAVFLCLVKHTQHSLQTVVHHAVKARYLHYDAVVHKALHKRVGDALLHLAAIVVVCLVRHVQGRLLYVADLMTEQIDGYHGDAVADTPVIAAEHVLWVGIVRAEVLAEAQCLGLKPCLLQLYEYQFIAAVVLADASGEVYAEHGYLVTGAVGVLVTLHLHMEDLLLQQG